MQDRNVQKERKQDSQHQILELHDRHHAFKVHMVVM